MAINSSALDPAQPTGLLLGGAFDQRNDDLTVVNPYDGATLATVAVGGPEDVAAAVRDALGHLPPPSAAERAQILERAAQLVSRRAETFARTICMEAGKPITQARGETARCIDTLTFAAVEARSLAGQVVPMDASSAGGGKVGVIVREPIGVVGAISPFNFPLNLVAHKLAPAIAAGCPVVLKPASSTPLSALLLAQTLADAGLPAGFLSVIPGGGGTVGNALVDHPDVPMISFTGSPPVGWGIRQRQPRKEVALELGNSTPVIVTADADIELAARKLAGVRLHPRRPVVHLGAARLRRGARARPLPGALRGRRGGPGGGRPDGRRHRRRPGDRRGQPGPGGGVDRRGGPHRRRGADRRRRQRRGCSSRPCWRGSRPR